MYIRIESAEEEEDDILTDSEVQRYLNFFQNTLVQTITNDTYQLMPNQIFVFFLTSILQMIGHKDSNYIRFLVVQYFAH